MLCCKWGQGNINNSIDGSDDIPFNEMISSVSVDAKEIDIVLLLLLADTAYLHYVDVAL